MGTKTNKHFQALMGLEVLTMESIDIQICTKRENTIHNRGPEETPTVSSCCDFHIIDWSFFTICRQFIDDTFIILSVAWKCCPDWAINKILHSSMNQALQPH